LLKDFARVLRDAGGVAHRTPDAMFKYAEQARGARAALHHRRRRRSRAPARHARFQDHAAGAGRAGALEAPRGQDSLYSIVQMPKGIPVATFAIGEAGAANAGLFAVSLLAGADANLVTKLAEYRAKLAEQVAAMQLPDVL
jgi:5-(carboxyamino)imidazole ribonucleotide mutase